MSTRSLCLLIVLSLGSRCDGQMIEDFDGPWRLSQRWLVAGEIDVDRVDVDQPLPQLSVEGKMVSIRAGAHSSLQTLDSMPRPDYERSALIRFRARCRSATVDTPLHMEFQVYSDSRRAWLWRKVSLTSSDWQTYELPLRFFRHSPGARVQWSETNRFALYFRNAGDIDVDAIEVVRGRPELLADEVHEIAMEHRIASRWQNGFFDVATDDPHLDTRQIAVELGRLVRMLYTDFPSLPQPRNPIPVVIYSKRADYQTFWPRLGNHFNSIVPTVESDGYAIFGIAGSSVENRHGQRSQELRPVFIQEACHALLARALRIANTSEWMHEGLANYYQLNWSGQDIHEITRKQVSGRSFPPLESLTSGRALSQAEYSQAVLFVKWLMVDNNRREKFYRAMQMMADNTRTHLQPVSQEAFGLSIDQMEQQWLHWAEQSLQ